MRPIKNRRPKIQPIRVKKNQLRVGKIESHPALQLVLAGEQYENRLKFLRIRAGLLPKNQHGGSRYPLPPHLENATLANITRWEKLYQQWSQHLQRFKIKLITEANKVGLNVDWKATSFFQDEKNVQLQLARIQRCLANVKRRKKK